MNVLKELITTLGPGLVAFLGLLILSKKARIVLRSTLMHPMRADVIRTTGHRIEVIPESEFTRTTGV